MCGKDFNIDDCVESLKLNKVFESGLGLVTDVEVKLVLKDNCKPIMLKSRSLPYALKDKVEEELNSMVKSGILTKIEDSSWGTSIVPVVRGSKVRICRDY